MTPAPVRLAITGSSGYVGQFVLQRRLARGDKVRALRRTQAPLPVPADEPNWLTGDLADQPQRRQLCAALVQDQTVLVHCAFAHAAGHYRGGEGSDPEQFWSANLLSTIALLEAAVSAGVERVVLLSSRAVMDGYLDPPGRIVDEQAPRPTTHYGALKAAEEALALHYAEKHSLTVSALRLTGVYGVVTPSSRSKWLDLVAAALRGAPAPAPRCGSEVHGEDVAAAVDLLLAQPKEVVSGRTFNCADIVVSNAQVLREAQRHCQSPLSLPAEAPAPNILLDCRALQQLGWQPGGQEKFCNTVQELVAVARSQSGSQS